MADSLWTGLGVAAGTDLSDPNDSTTGNLTIGESGAGVQAFITGAAGSVCKYSRNADPIGNGLTITGVANDVRRIELAHPATRGSTVQFRYTPSATPTADLEIASCRTGPDDAFTAFLLHLTTGVIRIRNSLSTGLASSPALVANHTYQIDAITDCNAGTPSTTNGRIVVRVTDLTDATWNTSGVYFYDSGYAVNVGTTQQSKWRVGKANTTGVHAQAYFAMLRWGSRSALNTSSDPTVAASQFATANPPTVTFPGNGVGYYIDAEGVAGNGGALNYSITQTGGSTSTPTLVAPGRWIAQQDTAAPRTYAVTVSETGGGSVTSSVVVPSGSSGTAGQFTRKRMTGGVLV